MSAGRHYTAVLANGVEVTLPARVWLDQDLVRQVFVHAGAEPWPALDSDAWVDVVLAIADAAAEDEEVAG